MVVPRDAFFVDTVTLCAIWIECLKCLIWITDCASGTITLFSFFFFIYYLLLLPLSASGLGMCSLLLAFCPVFKSHHSFIRWQKFVRGKINKSNTYFLSEFHRCVSHTITNNIIDTNTSAMWVSSPPNRNRRNFRPVSRTFLLWSQTRQTLWRWWKIYAQYERTITPPIRKGCW